MLHKYWEKNNKNKETVMGRKITVWIFQVTNLYDCTQEDRNVTKKGKSKERNLIATNSNT